MLLIAESIIIVGITKPKDVSLNPSKKLVSRHTVVCRAAQEAGMPHQ